MLVALDATSDHEPPEYFCKDRVRDAEDVGVKVAHMFPAQFVVKGPYATVEVPIGKGPPIAVLLYLTQVAVCCTFACADGTIL